MTDADSTSSKTTTDARRARKLPLLGRLLAGGLAALALVSGAQAAVVNGGFETPALAAGAYQTAPAGAGWTFTGTAGISRNGSTLTSGAPAAPEGVQQAFVRLTGRIAQSMALKPGDGLSLKATQRVNCCLLGGSEPLGIFVNGVQVGSNFTPPRSSWGTYVQPLGIAAAGTYTVEIRGLNGNILFDTTAFVDAVSIVSAPSATLTQPPAVLGMAVGTRLTFAATATDPNAGATVSKVAYYDGTTLLGSATVAPYNFLWTTTSGTRTVTAQATDSLGLTGTSPGVKLYVFATPAAPSTSISCAAEGGTCTLPAGTTATVWYGSGSGISYRNDVTGSVGCNNSTFGDPAFNIVKSCRYLPQAAALPTGATSCAAQNATCSVPAGTTATVFYGASGHFFARTGVTGSIACNDATLGDPLLGAGKTCYVVTNSIVKSSGDAQSGQVGTTLPTPLGVTVKDGVGNGVSGITVTFAVTAGGGSLSSASAATNASGVATTSLTLGAAVGANTVVATAAGIGSVTFNETAVAASSNKIVLSSATGGIGTDNVPMAYTASLQTGAGVALATAGVPITFTVTGGGAMFSPESTVSTTAGTASTTVVPTSPGTLVLTASSPGYTSATTTLVIANSAYESLFASLTPVTPDASDSTVFDLGTKFTAKQAGTLAALRFLKPATDTGTHVGKLWDAAGNLLAQVTFANETASGWQQQSLATPIRIAANTTYVVSVSTNGHFAVTNSGLVASVVSGDLATVADGANGVFSTTQGAFPTGSFQNSNYFRDVVFVPGPAPANPVLVAISGAGQSAAPGGVLSQPLVVQVTDAAGNPVAGQTVTFSVRAGGGSVATASAVTNANGQASTSATLGSAGLNSYHALVNGVGAVDFAEMADAAGAKSLTLSPLNAFAVVNSVVGYTATVVDGSGYVVTGATAPIAFSATGVAGTLSAASVVPSAGKASVTFTPTAAGTATISASSTGLTGASTSLGVAANVVAETVFTNQVPANNNASDNVSYELGMKFQSARPGQITAIDYYKAASETGTHTGHIWSAGGTLLATVTFTNETAGAGWQSQALPTPLHIAANTPYVVSVSTNLYYAFTSQGLVTSVVNGDLSTIADGNNGVFGSLGTFPAQSFQNANYFRDVNFVPDPIPLIKVSSGDMQSATAGQPLPQPFVAQVLGGDGKPLAGQTVTFAVTTGSGTVSPASAVTDASGLARTTLTMGTTGSRTVVTATAGTIGSVTFTAIVANPIFVENQNAGTAGVVSATTSHYTSSDIAGYADATSVNKGGSLPLRVTMATPGNYVVEVYRLGWYGGVGARLMSTSGSLAGVTQTPCAVTDATTHLVECKWNVSYTVSVGASWTSGLYMARLTNPATGLMHPIFFIVRDDSSRADILFQSSRSTSFAYGSYGTPTQGYSLYAFNSTGHVPAQKVSLDRPSTELAEYSNLFNFEYPMARWLESQGYDVTYTTNMDLHTGGAAVLQAHKLFLSVGHDEYWSKEMRDAVETARDTGVNLGFFSGNTAYWRVRFEPSSTGVANRVMVCYKDPVNTPDPTGTPTYTWRDPRNNRPENALLGVMYIGDINPLYSGFDMVVANAADPLFKNTGLANGSTLTGLVGYEWDGIVNNGFSPAGLATLASSPVTATTIAPDQPNNPAQTSSAVHYKAASGAQVFAMGTIEFMWSLDSFGVTPPRVDTRAQQFAVNLLANGGAKPLSPSPGIIVP